mmetsp:Transcript_81708/g.213031  ORF Transcript_81708/g.213031 Transcript_81708/m.213031 type:complete len:97 (-) Transcript_81708:1540-1830(-)
MQDAWYHAIKRHKVELLDAPYHFLSKVSKAFHKFAPKRDGGEAIYGLPSSFFPRSVFAPLSNLLAFFVMALPSSMAATVASNCPRLLLMLNTLKAT